VKATVVLCDPEEQFPVVIDGRDRRAFERRRDALGFSPGPIKDAAAEAPETYVAFLAWHALSRVADVGEFDSFNDRRLVEVVDLTPDSSDEPDPTRPAP
jgi:hypothetical protein